MKSATSYDGVFSIVKDRSNFLWGHPPNINQPGLYQHGHAAHWVTKHKNVIDKVIQIYLQNV